MEFKDFLGKEGEKPLDNIITDGGFVGIFRTIGCVGDSLASGELEGTNEHCDSIVCSTENAIAHTHHHHHHHH